MKDPPFYKSTKMTILDHTFEYLFWVASDATLLLDAMLARYSSV